MKHWRFNHVFRNEGDAGGGGGAGAGAAGGAAGGAGAGAAGAGAAGAGGGDGAAAGGAGAAGSALAAGAAGAGAGAGGGGASGGAAGGAAGAGGAEAGIPEKFVVKNAAGEVDHAATALKLAREGYLPLEKRLGSGDAPPQTVDGYKVNVPEALKGKIDPEVLAKDEGFKAFMGKLHAGGASQKVVDAAVATMLERGIAMREALPALQASECEATLRQADGWKTDQEYTQQVRTAFQAGSQIFGEAFKGMEAKGYFNDPDFIRGLATIGREMQEDRGPSPEAQQQIASNLDALMSSPAYLNSSDPKHAATVAQVNALHQQMHGNKPVSAGRTISFKSA